MDDSLAGLVVGVGEQDLPVGGQRPRVHRKAVVLAGDEAAARSLVDARLVVAPVTVPGLEISPADLACLRN